MTEQQQTEPRALQTWLLLNEELRSMTEEQCWALLRKEQQGKKRIQYMLRIFSRANKLRTERERAEIVTGALRRK